MMNFEIVKRQIIKACKDLEVTDIEEIRVFVDFFEWYYKEYFRHFKQEHKRLSTKSITTAIENMLSFDEVKGADDPICVLEDLAEKYFTCEFSHGTDYSITHFACPEILQNRFYEVML